MKKSDAIKKISELANEMNQQGRLDTVDLLEVAVFYLQQSPHEYLQSTGIGVANQPRCPLCARSLGNIKIAWALDLWRCVNCKTLFQSATK